MSGKAKFSFEEYQLMGVKVTDKVLGMGSYATVLELEYLGLKCAGKKIHDMLLQQGGDSYSVCRFQEECRLLSQARHPNIVQFLGVHFHPKVREPILVMEFLPTNLTSCIEEYGILPKEISYSILHDVALGLCYLHSQTPPIIHRDLSSNNVLLSPNMTAKISDLGVSRTISPQANRMTAAPGTPAYMPPEVKIANPKYNTSVDVFSYGILMIHTFSGQWPAPQAGPSQIENGQLTPVTEAERREVFLRAIGNNHPLMDLILGCVDNDPIQRAHASEIVDQVAAMTLRYPSSFANRLETLRHIKYQEEKNLHLNQEVEQLKLSLQKNTTKGAESNSTVVAHEDETVKQERSTRSPTSNYKVQQDMASNDVFMKKINKTRKEKNAEIQKPKEENVEIQLIQQLPERMESKNEPDANLWAQADRVPKNALHLKPQSLKSMKIVEKKEYLGSGSYGDVHVVQVEDEDTHYAAKRFKSRHFHEGRLKEKCLNELITLQHLDHQNIICFVGYSFWEDDGMPTLIMEKMDSSLTTRLCCQNYALSRSQKLCILFDVANGLDYLHTRNPTVIHRDLTANNVLLNRYLQAKIADFGNAKIVSSEERDKYMHLTPYPGTREYSAPEVAKGKYDNKCDIFSFGHLTLCTLSGRLNEELAGSRDEGKDGRLMAYTEVQRRSVYFDHLSDETTLLETLKTKECLEFLPSKRPHAHKLRDILNFERNKRGSSEPREVHQPCLVPQSNPLASSDSTSSNSDIL